MNLTNLIGKKANMLFCILVLSVSFVQAQSKVLKGTITDSNGEPMPGVSVLVFGTTLGTLSDFDGNYEVKIRDNAEKIVVSYLGYLTQEVKYEGQKKINFVLKEETNKLDEIVVVGYGTQRAKDVTGAISKIKQADIERTTNITVEQALTGRIAGVNTISSDGSLGAGMRIRIRGGTSVNANNEPLYVIDGIPIEVDYNIGSAPGLLEETPTSPLANLDPGSIVSIEVLKDASAAAIYGSRGANGVVLITTKTGKAGKTQITYNTNTSLSVVPENRYVGLLNTSQYGANLINQQLYANGIYNPDVRFSATVDGITYTDLTAEERQAIYDQEPDTDWQKEYFRMGIISNHALSVSGGSEGHLFSVRGAYLKNEGTVKNSFFKRYNLTLNSQNKLTEKLKLKTILTPSYSIKQGPTTGGGFTQKSMGSIIRTLSRQPNREVGQQVADDNEDSGVWVDPITEAQRTQSLTNSFNLIGSLNLIYQITKELTANVKLGANYATGSRKNYFPKDFGRGFQFGGIATRYLYRDSNVNNQNMLTYNNVFNGSVKHRLNAMVGFTQTYITQDSEYLESTDFDIETLGYDGLHLGQSPERPQVVLREKVLKSYLARVNYGIDDKYNFTVSMRADGSSVFNNNKWGYFPAAAFGWNAFKEDFLAGARNLSNLKLRLSYGQTGNAGIPFYASQSLMSDAFYVLGEDSSPVTGIANKVIGDPNLRWEFTDQYDAGLELGLFQNRISLVADVYYKRTEDLLLNEPIPPTTGFNSRLTNIGNVENKGLEIALNTVNIDKEFKWSTQFIFALNRNKVLSLGRGTQQTFPDQFTNGQYTGILQEGESLGNWFGYETAGIFSYDDFEDDQLTLKPELKNVYGNYKNDENPVVGDIKYVDRNGDGNINEDDRTIIARTQPKHFGSLYNNFSYKGFELGLFFTYKYGVDVINGNKYRINRTKNSSWNKTIEMTDAWTPNNPDGSMPRPDYGEDTKFTDRAVEDGSFIRFQSINASYFLPKKVVDRMGIASLKIYSNIDNVYIWTKYTGFDPEVSVARGQKAVTSANLDYGAYPRTLNISLGVQVGF